MPGKPPRQVSELERDALLEALRKVTEFAAGAENDAQRFVACSYIAAYGQAILDSYHVELDREARP